MSDKTYPRCAGSLRSDALHDSRCDFSTAGDRITGGGLWRVDAFELSISRGVEFKSLILRLLAKATTAARGGRSIRGPTSPVVPALARRPFGLWPESLEMTSMWEPSRKIT